MFFPTISFFSVNCKVVECNLFVSGDNGVILHIIANVYTSNFKPSYCTEGGAEPSRLTQLNVGRLGLPLNATTA